MLSCSKCGRLAEVQAGQDGALYCDSCIHQANRPVCMDCAKCYRRMCGDAVYACPFCHQSSGQADVAAFERTLKTGRIQPMRVEEKCERCGGALPNRPFILNGKALCGVCLFHEQKRWEIVEAKPGKHGARVKIIVEKKDPKPETENPTGKRLFHELGIDPENPPPDPFSAARTMPEKRMPDDSCKNCEDYSRGRKSKFVGSADARK